MRRSLIYGLFLLLACAGSIGAAPRKAKPPAVKSVSHWDTKNALEVPFEYNAVKENSPAVWLRINGGRPRLFIVDTGFSLPFVLTTRAAKEMKILAKSKEFTLQDVKYSLAFARRIALSLPATKKYPPLDAPLPVVPFARLHLPKNFLCITDGIKDITEGWQGTYSEPPAGIVGSGFLHQAYRAVQFDFVRRVMTLYPKTNTKTSPRLRIPGAATVPLHLLSNCYMVSVSPGARTQEMLIDTGDSNKVFIPDALAENFNTLDANRAAQTALRFGGSQEVFECLLPKLHIGSFTEEDIEAVTGEDKDVRPLLGINFLSRFRVTLDYAHREMTLERASDYKTHFRLPAANGLDLVIVIAANNVVVMSIPPRSPLTGMGLQPYDKLLSINGAAVTQENPSIYSTFFPQYKGDPVTMVVQHLNGEKAMLQFPMPGLYDALKQNPEKDSGIGLTYQLVGGPEITRVEAGSLAEKAGIQEGDVILAVNGKSALMKNKAAPDVPTFIPYGRSVIYTIQRKGEDQPREITIGYRVSRSKALRRTDEPKRIK